MDQETYENASDMELPGPGNSMTDLSVSQGAMVDDLHRNRNAKQETIKISLPLTAGGTPCAGCLRKGRTMTFLSIGDLTAHLTTHHIRSATVWVCSQCGKSFPKAHGWRCHYPKCKGVTKEGPSKSFACEECDETFETQIGLSMHERHRHPALRNKRRREQAERPKKTPGRKITVWTPEEVARLAELDAKFKEARFPNVEIQKYLPGKTTDQIRSRRKYLAKPANQACQLERIEEESAASQIIPQSDIQNEDEVETIDGGEDSWLGKMEEAIEAEVQIPNELKELHNQLMSIWGNRNNLDALCVDVDKFITEVLLPHLLQEHNTAKTRREKRRQSTRNGRKKGRNARRKYEFARAQELYKYCPKKLADMVLKDDLSMTNPPCQLPAEQQIKELYNQLWGVEGPTIKNFGDEQIETAAGMPSIPPINTTEVEKKIKKTRVKSAAGPDGVQKFHLNRQGVPVILGKIYNILLYANYFPECWKINRTTLIPKVGKDARDIKNWRPITIGSMMSRIFSSLIDSRLRAIVQNHIRQKGFTSENGCKQNVVLLAEAIQRCKASKGGVVSILDISKAFDTVPHSAISAALLRKQIPSRIAKYVGKMYDGCSTMIRTNEQKSIQVRIRRGVKQGDPLSPLLFNLCIEKLIGDIEEETKGLEISANRSIAILAFADDLVLLGEDEVQAQEQLSMVSAYLEKLNMSLSTNKCGTFQIKATKDTWYVKDPEVNIDQDRVPCIDPGEVFSYLGARFGPWRGLNKGLVVPDVLGTIKRIRTLPLKPNQKIELFLKYVLPHFMYSLLISPPSESTLKLLDNNIRQEIKEILHLVPSTATGFIYAPKASGGLGVPRLEQVVKLATLKNGIKMLSSEDQAIREVMQHDNAESRLKSIANSLRINWPATLEDIDNAKKRLKNETLKSWGDLKSQGQGVSDFRYDKIGNHWLLNPAILKASRYIDALRLRTNTYGTKVVLARAKKDMDVRCRRCQVQPETIGHVLGLCIHTKQLRIKRHDEIKNFIASKLAPSKEVAIEAKLSVGGSLYKPDLIVKNGNKAFIVDVTVRYENRDYLQKARQEKIEKYNSCIEEVKKRFGCTTGQVLAVVIGSRGAMPRSTMEDLKILGLGRKDAITIALNALRSSIEIANIFIDYD